MLIRHPDSPARVLLKRPDLVLSLIHIFSGLAVAPAAADDAPPNLIRLIAARETETAQAQSNYTYRQTVTLDELNTRGLTEGTYREVRDIIFSPAHERSEQMVGKPSRTLTHLQLTDEDFRDIREVQPFLLTHCLLYTSRCV